jgi:uncharacterized membrane protein YphA (DoxX/SURF4 family)
VEDPQATRSSSRAGISWARKLGALSGRFLLALVFIAAGLGKISTPLAFIQLMTGAGIPAAVILIYPAAAIEVLGGFALLIGLRARFAALVLLIYLIPVTILFHVRAHAQVMTLKNLSIMGGLLIVATQGGGGLSFDGELANDPGDDRDDTGQTR